MKKFAQKTLTLVLILTFFLPNIPLAAEISWPELPELPPLSGDFTNPDHEDYAEQRLQSLLDRINEWDTFTAHEQAVIMEQWRWAQEVPRHPASYIVEREISNAWFATVGDGASPHIALDRAGTIANREITRRLEEFGYVENGVPVRDFIIRPIESFLSPEFLARRALR